VPSHHSIYGYTISGNRRSHDSALFDRFSKCRVRPRTGMMGQGDNGRAGVRGVVLVLWGNERAGVRGVVLVRWGNERAGVRGVLGLLGIGEPG
jgi:hypothetical protein